MCDLSPGRPLKSKGVLPQYSHESTGSETLVAVDSCCNGLPAEFDELAFSSASNAVSFESHNVNLRSSRSYQRGSVPSVCSISCSLPKICSTLPLYQRSFSGDQKFSHCDTGTCEAAHGLPGGCMTALGIMSVELDSATRVVLGGGLGHHGY